MWLAGTASNGSWGAGVAIGSYVGGRSWFMVRGIADHGDNATKNDDWHPYASLAAAAYLPAIRARLRALRRRRATMAWANWTSERPRIGPPGSMVDQLPVADAQGQQVEKAAELEVLQLVHERHREVDFVVEELRPLGG